MSDKIPNLLPPSWIICPHCNFALEKSKYHFDNNYSCFYKCPNSNFEFLYHINESMGIHNKDIFIFFYFMSGTLYIKNTKIKMNLIEDCNECSLQLIINNLYLVFINQNLI